MLGVVAASLLFAICAIGCVRVILSQRAVGKFGLVLSGLVLFCLAAWIRLRLLVPHHIMYVDEPWYEEAARNLLRRGALVLCVQGRSGLECHSYSKLPGWPVLLAGVFAITGASDHVAFAVAGVLGALCAPVAGCVALVAGGRWYHGLFAGLIVAIHPLHALWSATSETNAPATLFLLVGLTGALLYLRDLRWSSLAMAIGGLGFAANMRAELVLAFAPLVAWACWDGLRQPRTRGPHALVVVAGAGLGAVSIPLGWRLETSISGESFFSASYIPGNFTSVISDPIGGRFTLIILVLACVGLISGILRSEVRAATTLAGSAVLVGLAVLACDPRMYIFSTRSFLEASVAAAPLAALATPRRRVSGPLWSAVVAVVFVLTARVSWPAVIRVPETQALESVLPATVAGAALPADALVLAEWPTVLRATLDTQVMPTSQGLEGGFAALSARALSGPVYLLCDMYCEPGFQGASGPSACRQVLDHFVLEEVVSTDLHSRRYGVYRLRGLSQGAPPPISCPIDRRHEHGS